MRKQFYIYLALFIFANIPTLVLLLEPFYGWAAWYVHAPVGCFELICSKLFQFADKIVHIIGWPFFNSIVLSVLIIKHILKYIKQKELTFII